VRTTAEAGGGDHDAAVGLRYLAVLCGRGVPTVRASPLICREDDPYSTAAVVVATVGVPSAMRAASVGPNNVSDLSTSCGKIVIN